MTVSAKRRRGIMLNVKIAYPGILGGWQMVAPPGMMFLTDDDGVYLTDDNGNFLVGVQS